MTRALLAARSGALWTASVIHFVPGALWFAACSRVAPGRFPERALKGFCRNVVRLAGARFRVVRAPRFDPGRTAVFVANHVNVFDPFTLAAAIPQPARGFELASHFDVPVYGALMRHAGNIPVPDRPTRATIGTMRHRTAEALSRGRSLILFPEGTRTRTGAVGPFRPGLLRMVSELGATIVPVTQSGAFTLQHPGQRTLRPATITVTLHDPIDTAAMTSAERESLPERLRDIVAAGLP